MYISTEASSLLWLMANKFFIDIKRAFIFESSIMQPKRAGIKTVYALTIVLLAIFCI
jgi:hypothetical protein